MVLNVQWVIGDYESKKIYFTHEEDSSFTISAEDTIILLLVEDTWKPNQGVALTESERPCIVYNDIYTIMKSTSPNNPQGIYGYIFLDLVK